MLFTVEAIEFIGQLVPTVGYSKAVETDVKYKSNGICIEAYIKLTFPR